MKKNKKKQASLNECVPFPTTLDFNRKGTSFCRCNSPESLGSRLIWVLGFGSLINALCFDINTKLLQEWQPD